ncbi:unnamed protein product [Acanthosepion pharaonis]|uniref:C-type lectin domain-containing protein n=1 Tax=Acanthosepion pharaonis TaxID=158019 RepID=A0A812C8W4_ACAPH|nr:unnamed protein product [Sepia pharaonis]
MLALSIWVLFVSTGSGLNNWFQVNSKCFQANRQTSTHRNAVLTCQKSDASLYSVKDQNELNSLSNILNTKSQYWTTAKFDGKTYKWEDGRTCCPLSWWGQGEPNDNDTCVRLRSSSSKWLLFDRACSYLFGSICVKDRVRKWKPVKVYDLEDLCGVEIMPNCGGLRCEDVCQSHHDCDQFAEMANVCVNMKNISETDNCVVKLRPNLTLYRLEWNC